MYDSCPAASPQKLIVCFIAAESGTDIGKSGFSFDGCEIHDGFKLFDVSADGLLISMEEGISR